VNRSNQFAVGIEYTSRLARRSNREVTRAFASRALAQPSPSHSRVPGWLAITSVRLGADDWPEWRGAGRLGVWNETGILSTSLESGLAVSWRAPIRAGYSGPSVAGGRVFITDSQRVKANETVERALALDEKTGRVLWTREWRTNYSGLFQVYAIGPRATPTVDGDRVYVLGTMGNLLALDVNTGRILWQRDYVKDFNVSVPTWGMSGAPLVDGDRLICIVGGEPDGKVIALNKLTGEEIWRSLSSDSNLATTNRSSSRPAARAS
jgi:outer membrane protein assembly factor BamB